jgi:hypothetical protein
MKIFKKKWFEMAIFKDLLNGVTSVFGSNEIKTAFKYWKDSETGKEYIITEKVTMIVDEHALRFKESKTGITYRPANAFKKSDNSIVSIERVDN